MFERITDEKILEATKPHADGELWVVDFDRAIADAQLLSDRKKMVEWMKSYICCHCSTPNFVQIVIPLNKWEELIKGVKK